MGDEPTILTKGAGEAVSGLASIIPEFHFDLISRIIPGSYLALGLANACSPRFLLRLTGLWGPWGADGKEAPAILIGIGTLVIGYVFGLMLTAQEAVWRIELVRCLFETKFKKLPSKLQKQIRLRFPQGSPNWDWIELHRLLQDDLKEEIPRAAFLLPKMRAEEKLFVHLEIASYWIVGLTILIRLLRSAFGFYPSSTCADWGWTAIAVGGVLLFSVCCRFTWKKRYLRYLDGLFSYAGRLFRIKCPPSNHRTSSDEKRLDPANS